MGRSQSHVNPFSKSSIKPLGLGRIPLSLSPPSYTDTRTIERECLIKHSCVKSHHAYIFGVERGFHTQYIHQMEHENALQGLKAIESCESQMCVCVKQEAAHDFVLCQSCRTNNF